MDIKMTIQEVGQMFNARVINYQAADLNWKAYIEGKPTITKRELRLFISYSHEDVELKNELDLHLSALRGSYPLTIWSDEELVPGQDWDYTIKKSLVEADVILLLISPGFIASEYIWKNELTTAIERHDLGQAIVIPIFGKPCEFKHMPFAKLQGLPQYALPISTMSNRYEAMAAVAKGIQLVLDRFMKTAV